MRLFLWGVLIVVVCYAAYSGMIAFSSWMKVNGAVDEIVSREGVETVPSRELKARVMTAANEAGVPIGERDVIVTNDGRGRVTIEHDLGIVGSGLADQARFRHGRRQPDFHAEIVHCH